MPKLMYSYIRFDIIQFLLEYEKFPCLWWRRDPNFKNRTVRDTAERFLLQKFNFGSIKDLRQKIRNIRGTYNQEKKKVKNSLEVWEERKLIDIYKPKLVWYDIADSFLKKNELENDNESNMVTEEEDCPATETEEESISYPEEFWSEPSPMRPASQATASQPQTLTNLGYLKRKREQNGSFIRGIKSPRSELGSVNRSIIAKLDDLLDNSVNSLTEVALKSPSINEFTIFGEHVASQLQTLPIVEALQLQADIQSLITSVRVRYLQNTSSDVRKLQITS